MARILTIQEKLIDVLDDKTSSGLLVSYDMLVKILYGKIPVEKKRNVAKANLSSIVQKSDEINDLYEKLKTHPECGYGGMIFFKRKSTKEKERMRKEIFFEKFVDGYSFDEMFDNLRELSERYAVLKEIEMEIEDKSKEKLKLEEQIAKIKKLISQMDL